MARPFTITTAISYPNGRPHIGHAYEAIATDAIARAARMMGRDVFFQTGTDEHGLKMAQTARARGITPSELAEEMSSYFKEMDDALGISYDRFIRTTEPAHHVASQAIWQAMADAGDLYTGRYEGWYSVRDEAYYGDEEVVEGEGGEKLSPQGTPVEWTVEESWFFRLSKYQEPLLKLYSRASRIHPAREPPQRSDALRRVRSAGSQRLALDLRLGREGAGRPDHVMYVWVDALTNYITGCGYPDDQARMARYWPNGGDIVHIIGKDIVRFHAVYWPAFLMSAGLPLPKTVFGHGFLLNRGAKDVEVARQRRRSDRLIDAFRRRCAALFPAALRSASDRTAATRH
jgi:methionyl-tRNA synthetase